MTDRRAAFVEENPVSPADLTATIFDTLKLRADAEVPTRDGTRHRLSTGRVVRELFA